MSKSRRFRRSVARERHNVADVLKPIRAKYIEDLNKSMAGEFGYNHKLAFKQANEAWKEKTKEINAQNLSTVAKDTAFETWVWNLLKAARDAKKLSGEAKLLVRAVRKSVGLKWLLMMWFNDLKK